MKRLKRPVQIFQSAIFFQAFLYLIAFPSMASGEIQTTPTQLTEQEQQLVNWVGSKQAIMLKDLETYVNINTWTMNRDGLDQFRDLLDEELQSLGFETTLKPSGEIELLSCQEKKVTFAQHLLGQRIGKSSTKVLLNGHLDTVFPKDDEFQTMVIETDGKIKGPGVLDMKGGIVAMTYALKALHQHGRLQNSNITVFFNTDEEVGSLGSRPYIEELAMQHDVGLVFEGSHNHKLARQRKGLGQARIKVIGREAHAGEAHVDGVSANLELAHKVIALEALTDYEKKTTVNVGIMQGGETRNTRPGCADAFVDLRFADNHDGLELKTQVERIALTRYTNHSDFPALPKSEVWSVLHRPAKAIHPTTDNLIAEAMGLSTLIGEPIVGTYWAGGGTDGSLMQAKGLPTVDSLGLNGDGVHSSREWTTTKSLMARTKLITVFLDRLIHQ
ncbi:M20 family metallopeptidase [Candidatus Nitronereus thalassa]|uniref:M20 family metallopeptidase n=1 Tax=Candidatus Nitronereus thalassa TaxID=3020898 RepID=A0ABU3K9C2_9BACT|nr:M20 family metallopeptidase [Candidatus Nitronereus thalassa]MDT7042962.1 M20 family metallopeptidase [Candidatus Nitronereus thalassa]